MGAPKVSVVMPVLNEEEFLEQTLKTIRAQTFKDYELIVVDNGSTDRSREIAARFADRVLVEPQRGYDLALHRGISEAQGELIVQADADTLYPPHWLARMVQAFEGKGVVCAYGPWAFRESPRWRKPLEAGLCIVVQLLTHALGLPQTTGLNMGFRKEAYVQVGGYPALRRLSAIDVRLGLRLRRVGKVRFVPKMLVYTSNRAFRKRGALRHWLLMIRNFWDIVLHRDRLTLDHWYAWRRD
ncbi:MAG: glycosyltransferase family 2 protein [Candidatus Bipolaricaulota bacterium]|nr:glycosyltransferase family 2 protein [Candidatus Bipolaricaulota bacterium]MDW8127231.1 glycosyltransferase family A protein [Candidatus Bipolaricaulota bacterium]